MSKKDNRKEELQVCNDDIDKLTQRIDLLIEVVRENNGLIKEQQNTLGEILKEKNSLKKRSFKEVFAFLFGKQEKLSSNDLLLFLKLTLTSLLFFIQLFCGVIIIISLFILALSIYNKTFNLNIIASIMSILIALIFMRISQSAKIIIENINEVDQLSGLLSGFSGFLAFVIATISLLLQLL